MELYQEILAHAIWQYGAKVEIPGLELDAQTLVENTCYQALQKIKAVIEDDSLDDPTCFKKIEEIISALEDVGCGGSFRHDFG